MKTVFVFKCDDSNLLAYTFDESGKNLPANEICRLGWHFLKKIQISEDPYSLIGENPKSILDSIASIGYFVKKSS